MTDAEVIPFPPRPRGECSQCGGTFLRTRPWHDGLAAYCSPACALRAQWRLVIRQEGKGGDAVGG